MFIIHYACSMDLIIANRITQMAKKVSMKAGHLAEVVIEQVTWQFYVGKINLADKKTVINLYKRSAVN